MARTIKQEVGSWFTRAGKFAVLSPALTDGTAAGVDLYLFAVAYKDEGDDTVAALNAAGSVPSGVSAFLVTEVGASEINSVSDIPEGYAFYLTDNTAGTAPTNTDVYSCVTWSE